MAFSHLLSPALSQTLSPILSDSSGPLSTGSEKNRINPVERSNETENMAGPLCVHSETKAHDQTTGVPGDHENPKGDKRPRSIYVETKMEYSVHDDEHDLEVT